MSIVGCSFSASSALKKRNPLLNSIHIVSIVTVDYITTKRKEVLLDDFGSANV